MYEYDYLIPLWMRSDSQFYTWWTSIVEEFNKISSTQENIKKDISLVKENKDIFKKLCKIYNIPEYITLPKGTIIVDKIYQESGSWKVNTSTTSDTKYIEITSTIRYYLLKYKLLMNNFKGTYKNLEELSSNLFNNEKELSFSFKDITILGDSNYPKLEISISFNSLKEETLNTQEYLDLCTLFLNGFFKFNLMGVILVYNISGTILELRWNEGKWNKNIWNALVKE